MSAARRHAAMVGLALGVAGLCWVAAGVVAGLVGADGFWPLGEVIAVFGGLTALERFLRRRDAGH